MHHYVITGGAGFIGSNLADFYLARGRRVVIVDNFSRPGSEKNLAWLKSRHRGKLKVVAADIRHSGPRLSAAIEGAEAVFHLAAQVAVTTSVIDPRHDFETNALGTFNVLETVRKSAPGAVVLYASTNKVYGKMADLGIVERDGRYAYASIEGGIPETRPLDPYSPYGCSKCAGDQYVLDYARIYGMRTVVFRQSCIYGPRQFGMEDQGWLAWFAIRALERKPVTIYGDGKQVRDVLYVDDLLEAYDAAVRHIETASGRAYNIGGGPANTLSLLELVHTLDERFGRPLERSFEEWRPGDQQIFVSDVSRAAADLEWRPRVSVSDGVGRLVDWVRANEQIFAPPRVAAMGQGGM